MRILTETQETDLKNALSDARSFQMLQASTAYTETAAEVYRSRARTYGELAQLLGAAHAIAISEPTPE